MQVFIYCKITLTCFGCPSHPSSGVPKTVTTASGTGHSIWATTFLHVGERLLLRYYDLLSVQERSYCWHVTFLKILQQFRWNLVLAFCWTLSVKLRRAPNTNSTSKQNSRWILLISKMGHCTWKWCMIQNVKVKVTSWHAYLGPKGRWRYGYYPLASQEMGTKYKSK